VASFLIEEGEEEEKKEKEEKEEEKEEKEEEEKTKRKNPTQQSDRLGPGCCCWPMHVNVTPLILSNSIRFFLLSFSFVC